MGSPKTITEDDIELVTNRILGNLSEITEILYKEYTPIDKNLLYEHFQQQTESHTFAQPQPTAHRKTTEPLDLDSFESIFKELDEIDVKLSNVKVATAKAGKAKTLKRAESVCDVAGERSMLASSLLFGSRLALNEDLVPENPKNSSRICDDLIDDFNHLLDATAPTTGDPTESEYEEVYQTFYKAVNQLKFFANNIEKYMGPRSGSQTEDPFPSLNEDFAKLLGNLAQVC